MKDEVKEEGCMELYSRAMVRWKMKDEGVNSRAMVR